MLLRYLFSCILCTIIVTAQNSCNNGNCNYDIGYLPNSDNGENLPDVTEYYGRCKDNSQCKWLGDNAECNTFCVCKENYRWYQGECKHFVGYDQTCASNLDCYNGIDPLALKCENNKCVCADDYYLRPNNDCRKKSKENSLCAINADCQDSNLICTLGKCKPINTTQQEKSFFDQPNIIVNNNYAAPNCANNCAEIENSICYTETNTCICPQGYFVATISNVVKCIPEIGMKSECSKDEDCPIRPGVCDKTSKTCYCRDYYAVEDGNRRCVKTMWQDNFNCLSREWCSVLGQDAYCGSDAVCKCSKNAKFDEASLSCIHQDGGEEPECRTMLDCSSKLKNSDCVDETCQCGQGYKESDNECVAGIGSECLQDYIDCNTGLICDENENKCKCQADYVDIDEFNCLPEINTLGAACENSKQCTVLSSVCSDKKCTCDSDFIPYNNVCYARKEYNEYCSNSLQCKLSLGDSFVCRKQTCTCPTESKLIDGNKCSGVLKINYNFHLIFIMLLLNSIMFFVN